MLACCQSAVGSKEIVKDAYRPRARRRGRRGRGGCSGAGSICSASCVIALFGIDYLAVLTMRAGRRLHMSSRGVHGHRSGSRVLEAYFPRHLTFKVASTQQANFQRPRTWLDDPDHLTWQQPSGRGCTLPLSIRICWIATSHLR